MYFTEASFKLINFLPNFHLFVLNELLQKKFILEVNICKGLTMTKETCNFPLVLEAHWTHYRNGLGTRNFYIYIYIYCLGFWCLFLQFSANTALRRK